MSCPFVSYLRLRRSRSRRRNQDFGWGRDGDEPDIVSGRTETETGRYLGRKFDRGLSGEKSGRTDSVNERFWWLLRVQTWRVRPWTPGRAQEGPGGVKVSRGTVRVSRSGSEHTTRRVGRWVTGRDLGLWGTRNLWVEGRCEFPGETLTSSQGWGPRIGQP